METGGNTKPARSRGRDKQQQGGENMGGQNAAENMEQGGENAGGSAGATSHAVIIEEAVVPPRGNRMLAEEKWPFGLLTPATRTDAGEIKGPSFFIPESEGPDAALASARKRHKDVNFISRKDTVNGVVGMRVWQKPVED